MTFTEPEAQKMIAFLEKHGYKNVRRGSDGVTPYWSIYDDPQLLASHIAAKEQRGFIQENTPIRKKSFYESIKQYFGGKK